MWAGCNNATICGRPVASPKRTSDSAAFPRTMGEGIGQHFQQRLVKARARSVLAHDPGVGVANFLHRIVGQPYQFGIPLLGGCVGMRHAFAHLHQRMLDVPRLLVVVQILSQLLVREMASKPRVPPEQKRHEDDKPAGGKKQNLLGA